MILGSSISYLLQGDDRNNASEHGNYLVQWSGQNPKPNPVCEVCEAWKISYVLSCCCMTQNTEGPST